MVLQLGSVFVGPGRKPHDRVSHYAAQIIKPLPVSVITVRANKKGANPNAHGENDNIFSSEDCQFFSRLYRSAVIFFRQ